MRIAFSLSVKTGIREVWRGSVANGSQALRRSAGWQPVRRDFKLLASGDFILERQRGHWWWSDRRQPVRRRFQGCWRGRLQLRWTGRSGLSQLHDRPDRDPASQWPNRARWRHRRLLARLVQMRSSAPYLNVTKPGDCLTQGALSGIAKVKVHGWGSAQARIRVLSEHLYRWPAEARFPEGTRLRT